MDLPTYTNIWRIEKRLYKLYDFRLPMPLPINWIAVFAGITIPYIVLLIAVGLPFNHSLVWLYVLPPGLLTWLSTRPVLESKRLPELVESQVRWPCVGWLSRVRAGRPPYRPAGSSPPAATVSGPLFSPRTTGHHRRGPRLSAPARQPRPPAPPGARGHHGAQP